jgi:hypothetical protein
MQPASPDRSVLSEEVEAFYRRAIAILERAGIPCMVGGAYALERYAAISRHTKDLDLFLRPDDCPRALLEFSLQGYHADLTYPHWLGKVHASGAFIDLIFASGNGVARVDDTWFACAVPDRMFDLPVQLCPVEEMIWSKAFVMERERYDGADIAHLLRARAGQLDWPRLLARFGPHWRLLLVNLILFGYIYPAEQSLLPRDVLEELLGRLAEEYTHIITEDRVCGGTMLSRGQYLPDIEAWGYRDARLDPYASMSPQAIADWTAAIDRHGVGAAACAADPRPH